MTFPITEYPLCITHSGISGLKTEKCKLLNKLEELQAGFTKTPLPLIDVTLIDGGQLIHSFLSAIGKITSYGNLVMTLLAYVCGSGGILVILSNSTTFKLRHVKTFPITEYPLCITHSGVSGLKTEKSKLLNKLGELQDGFTETPLPLIDVTLIDGGQLIYSFLSAIGKIISYGNHYHQ